MKTLTLSLSHFLTCGLLLVATGCTITHVETAQMKIRRVSFLQKVEIPQLKISTNGAVQLQGYANDGGSEAAALITAAAVSAAMKSVAP